MARRFKIDLINFITEFSGYKHSITFVGNLSSENTLKILCELIKNFKNKLSIFADEKQFLKSKIIIKKEKFLEENELRLYEKSYKGEIPKSEDLPELYSSSRINLTVNTRKKSLTDMQIFEVLASGGFLITNEREDLEKYFEPSRNLETFVDTADLIDKIDFYLKNMDVAERIAQLGRFEVIRNYTVSPKRKKKAKVKYNRSL